MNATDASVDAPRPLSFDDLFIFWNERCQKFLQWQRRTFIDRDPSPAELAEHTKRLKFMVRFTLHLYAQAADPDSPHPEALRAIVGTLKQLEDWRTVIHNPLSDAEAEAILARAFPDEARTGSAPLASGWLPRGQSR